MGSRLAGSHIRAWHRFWTDYGVPIPSTRDFVFPSERERLEKLVRTEMEQVYKLAGPLVVEIGVEPNLRDLD
jgi:hypothetical protein